MSYIDPIVAEFKTFFSRDFPFGTDPAIAVIDADIIRAQYESTVKINSSLYSSQEEYALGHNYLSAHHLVTNLKNSSQGLSSKWSWPIASKSVSSVSNSYAIPNEVMSNPYFAYYMSTSYGAQYLMMIYPLLSGNVGCIAGATLP